jgi:hypothetical protein
MNQKASEAIAVQDGRNLLLVKSVIVVLSLVMPMIIGLNKLQNISLSNKLMQF